MPASCCIFCGNVSADVLEHYENKHMTPEQRDALPRFKCRHCIRRFRVAGNRNEHQTNCPAQPIARE